MRKKPIYLHNLQLRSSTEFEKQFESFLRGVVKVENGEDNVSNQIVTIRQRSIHVNVNNTWRNLNGNEERFTIMDEPSRDGICRGQGSIELPNYIEHSLVALTFRIEFTAHLPLKTGNR